MIALLLSFFSKFKLEIIVILLTAGILTAALAYFNYSQNQIKALSGQIAQVTVELNDTKAAYQAAKDDALRNRAQVDALNGRIMEIRTTAQKQIVVVQKHDLGRIAEKHPTLLENRINKATAARLKRLEELSRAR